MIVVASWLLTLCGLALIGIGGYFILARPALLPEDARFMGTCPGRLARPSVLRGPLVRVVGATEHRERPPIARSTPMRRGAAALPGMC